MNCKIFLQFVDFSFFFNSLLILADLFILLSKKGIHISCRFLDQKCIRFFPESHLQPAIDTDRGRLRKEAIELNRLPYGDCNRKESWGRLRFWGIAPTGRGILLVGRDGRERE